WTAANFGRLHPWHARGRFLTCCHWEVPGEDGLILVTHNWTPFVMDFTKLRHHSVAALDGRAIDGDYLYENFSDEGIGSRIHVIEDSDSLFLLGLTPVDEMVPRQDSAWWLSWPPLSEWSRGYILNRTVFDPGIDRLRRKIYHIPVRWHAGDITPRWQASDQEVKRLLSKYATVDFDRDAPALGVSFRERFWRRLLRVWLMCA